MISEREHSWRLRSRADCQLDVEASLVAILVAVLDVCAVRLAFDADLLIQSDVIELNGHQGLQVHGVQQLAVVRVVLERETVANAEVIDLSDLVFIFGSLQTVVRVKTMLSGAVWPWQRLKRTLVLQ